MREWLSGGASPCQGEGRGFDPRLALLCVSAEMPYSWAFPPFYIFTKCWERWEQLSNYGLK